MNSLSKFTLFLAIPVMAVLIGTVVLLNQNTSAFPSINPHAELVMTLPTGDKGFCSGTFITQDEILTAGHCVQGPDNTGTIKQFIVDVQPFTQKDAQSFKPMTPLLTSTEWVDTVNDIAVVKIVSKLDVKPVGIDCKGAAIGEQLEFYGTPLGNPNLVMRGYVAGPDSIGNNHPITPVDATILPGMSGGSAINSDGEIVGINDLTATYGFGVVPLGYLVPSSTICSVLSKHAR